MIWLSAFLCANTFAQDLTLELNFPSENIAKATAPRPLTKPIAVSGNATIDITPYPDTIEKDRYLVEYFLDDQLFFQTSGFDESNPDKLSFRCLLDTAKFENGRYKLIVNFWDKSGASAIGIQEIEIRNEGG